MTNIAIIVALQGEAKPLLKLVGSSTAGRLGRRKTWHFQTGACRCVMILSGMGLEPARRAARALMGAESPQGMMSFGIAGALGQGLSIGDIVAGEQCRMWENGQLGRAFPLAALSEAAQQAAFAAAAALDARCARGTVVTVRGIQSIPAVPGAVSVVEMETFAIAQVAAERGIPLFSIRSISDSPDEPIPFTMGGGEDFHLQPFTLLGAIIRKPRIIRPLLRLKHNSARAARNLAEVVFAALSRM
jgi:adenosylhomocysteine nucleosidase